MNEYVEQEPVEAAVEEFLSWVLESAKTSIEGSLKEARHHHAKKNWEELDESLDDLDWVADHDLGDEAKSVAQDLLEEYAEGGTRSV